MVDWDNLSLRTRHHLGHKSWVGNLMEEVVHSWLKVVVQSTMDPSRCIRKISEVCREQEPHTNFWMVRTILAVRNLSRMSTASGNSVGTAMADGNLVLVSSKRTMRKTSERTMPEVIHTRTLHTLKVRIWMVRNLRKNNLTVEAKNQNRVDLVVSTMVEDLDTTNLADCTKVCRMVYTRNQKMEVGTLAVVDNCSRN